MVIFFRIFMLASWNSGFFRTYSRKKILACGLLKFSPFTVGKPGARSHFKGPQAKAKALGVFLVASGTICDGIIVARSRHSIFSWNEMILEINALPSYLCSIPGYAPTSVTMFRSARNSGTWGNPVQDKLRCKASAGYLALDSSSYISSWTLLSILIQTAINKQVISGTLMSLLMLAAHEGLTELPHSKTQGHAILPHCTAHHLPARSGTRTQVSLVLQKFDTGYY